MSYSTELDQSMLWLSKKPNVVFIGQGVRYGGTFISDSFKGIPKKQRIEWPVAEDMQLGACIGMALEGLNPICIFPRWNFALCATNQLVNHLSAIPFYSEDPKRRTRFWPKVIVRIGVGSTQPLDGGKQHCGNFTEAFKSLLFGVQIYDLRHGTEIRKAYEAAWRSDLSCLIVEHQCLYQLVKGVQTGLEI